LSTTSSTTIGDFEVVLFSITLRVSPIGVLTPIDGSGVLTIGALGVNSIILRSFLGGALSIIHFILPSIALAITESGLVSAVFSMSTNMAVNICLASLLL